MNIIIKNLIEICGNVEDVQRIIKEVRSKSCDFDFNKIQPIDPDKDDLCMDEYICECLNLYASENKLNNKRFFDMCEFVGKTRKNPYDFKVMTAEQLNTIRAKKKTEIMLKDAESFLNKIKSKSIFNGYMIRETFWGTGSEPVNVRIKNNVIEFDTYDKAPVTLIKILAKKYPNVTIYYTYCIDGKINKVSIKNDNIKVIREEKVKEPTLYELISQNITI